MSAKEPPGLCEALEADGSVCGEPVLVGKVCYDHAKLGPEDQPLCPISGVWLRSPPTEGWETA